jgi:hypothetical protein
MDRKRPKFDSPDSLLPKASRMTDKPARSVSEALSALASAISAATAPFPAAAALAARLSQCDPDLALAWADGAVAQFLAAAADASGWFASPQSGLFLFAAQIGAGTNRESQLRVIGDYALAKFQPQSPQALADHLRIASVLVEQCGAREAAFPSGAVALLTAVLRGEFAFAPASAFETAFRLFEKTRRFPIIFRIWPELCARLPDGEKFTPLRELAAAAALQRIEEHRGRRVFPPMIQMIRPQLERAPKAKTEDERLRRALKNAQRKARQMEQKVAKDNREAKMEEIAKKRALRVQTRKQMIAMMEAERSYDLNLAAAAPREKESGEAPPGGDLGKPQPLSESDEESE